MAPIRSELSEKSSMTSGLSTSQTSLFSITDEAALDGSQALPESEAFGYHDEEALTSYLTGQQPSSRSATYYNNGRVPESSSSLSSSDTSPASTAFPVTGHKQLYGQSGAIIDRDEHALPVIERDVQSTSQNVKTTYPQQTLTSSSPIKSVAISEDGLVKTTGSDVRRALTTVNPMAGKSDKYIHRETLASEAVPVFKTGASSSGPTPTDMKLSNKISETSSVSPTVNQIGLTSSASSCQRRCFCTKMLQVVDKKKFISDILRSIATEKPSCNSFWHTCNSAPSEGAYAQVLGIGGLALLIMAALLLFLSDINILIRTMLFFQKSCAVQSKQTSGKSSQTTETSV